MQTVFVGLAGEKGLMLLSPDRDFIVPKDEVKRVCAQLAVLADVGKSELIQAIEEFENS